MTTRILLSHNNIILKCVALHDHCSCEYSCKPLNYININVFYKKNMRCVSLLTNVITKLEDTNKTHEM